jgi:DNA-binding transcriptional ArsR family regulator
MKPAADGEDRVFRALADASRRQLLDLLHAENGQTLGALAARLPQMSRQAVTQHLAVLEEANLVVSQKRGREKLHFINPVPIHEIYRRWVAKFETERLNFIRDLKTRLEGERRK